MFVSTVRCVHRISSASNRVKRQITSSGLAYQNISVHASHHVAKKRPLLWIRRCQREQQIPRAPLASPLINAAIRKTPARSVMVQPTSPLQWLLTHRRLSPLPPSSVIQRPARRWISPLICSAHSALSLPAAAGIPHAALYICLDPCHLRPTSRPIPKPMRSNDLRYMNKINLVYIDTDRDSVYNHAEAIAASTQLPQPTTLTCDRGTTRPETDLSRPVAKPTLCW